jgi:hypothetical protein
MKPIAIDKVHRRSSLRSVSNDGAKFIRAQDLGCLACENPSYTQSHERGTGA